MKDMEQTLHLESSLFVVVRHFVKMVMHIEI